MVIFVIISKLDDFLVNGIGLFSQNTEYVIIIRVEFAHLRNGISL